MINSGPAKNILIPIALLVASLLQACGTSSGPITKHGGYIEPQSVMWHEPLIDGCQNVSMAKRIRAYESRYDHSTTDSLVIEVLQEGARLEFNTDGETSSSVKLRDEFLKEAVLTTFGLDGSDDPFDAFCMQYKGPTDEVLEIVRSTVRVLGNEVIFDRQHVGEIRTSILERENINKKWRDAYFIFVEEVDSETSNIHIYRHMETLRTGGWVYAKSDGHNEAWFLQWIRTRL